MHVGLWRLASSNKGARAELSWSRKSNRLEVRREEGEEPEIII